MSVSLQLHNLSPLTLRLHGIRSCWQMVAAWSAVKRMVFVSWLGILYKWEWSSAVWHWKKNRREWRTYSTKEPCVLPWPTGMWFKQHKWKETFPTKFSFKSLNLRTESSQRLLFFLRVGKTFHIFCWGRIQVTTAMFFPHFMFCDRITTLDSWIIPIWNI